MRNKPWKNTQTAIELTSLLDVIFIVLMIVVCNQQVTTKNQMQEAEAAVIAAEEKEQSLEDREEAAAAKEQAAQQKLEEAQSMAAMAQDLIDEKEFYAEQLDTYSSLTDEILAVTVYVDYEPSDLKQRKIRILSGTKELESIDLNPSNSTEAWSSYERKMGSLLQEHKDIPVILAVNKSQILLRDEKKLREITEKLGQSHDNLFQKPGASDE